MTFIFCIKAIIACISLELAVYVCVKALVYPFIVFYRWAMRDDDIFYLHDDCKNLRLPFKRKNN